MSEENKTETELPPYTATVPVVTVTEKKRSTKKYVTIAVSVILTAVIVLTAILVGIYLFYNAEKDLLKFSLKFAKDSKQDVTSDPNNNVVQYYVQNSDYDLWVINDFNRAQFFNCNGHKIRAIMNKKHGIEASAKASGQPAAHPLVLAIILDIQTLKVKSKTSTVCYVTPLNRTAALSPSDINEQHSNNNNNYSGRTEEKRSTVKFHTTATTIPDVSFLSKTAKEFCNGVSTYWVYPYCETGTGPINKRRDVDLCVTTIYWCCESYYDYCYTVCYYDYYYYC